MQKQSLQLLRETQTLQYPLVKTVLYHFSYDTEGQISTKARSQMKLISETAVIGRACLMSRVACLNGLGSKVLPHPRMSLDIEHADG